MINLYTRKQVICPFDINLARWLTGTEPALPMQEPGDTGLIPE